MTVSIIIVHYRVEKELLNCIKSIYTTTQHVSFEIIVVDNDENPHIKHKLLKTYPDIRYLHGHGNIGYGPANNLGALHAKGHYLLFLNPDTQLSAGCIKTLVSFMRSDPEVGVIAPTLYHPDGEIYTQQGSRTLTPLTMAFSHSIISRIFPQNPIARRFWLTNQDRSIPYSVDVVPGTAMCVSRNAWERVGGFDPRFFLYFEESDLCKRIIQSGLRCMIHPDARLIHTWEASSQDSDRSVIKAIYQKSRWLYLNKHYRGIRALIAEMICRISIYTILLSIIVTTGALLRYTDISGKMMFIGDFGWFYLSARDMLLTGNIPLVGIESSRVWLNQGPLWTYLTALSLRAGNYHPVAPALLASTLGTVTVIVSYHAIKTYLGSLSRPAALAVAMYTAWSPFIILQSRMPYHTTPLPLTIWLWFWAMVLWHQKGPRFFPFVTLMLGLMYSFHLGSVIFVYITALAYLWSRYAQTAATKALSKRIALIAGITGILPLTPVIIYDVFNGFKQTLLFGAWNIYTLIRIPFSLFGNIGDQPGATFINDSLPYITRLFFPESDIYSLLALLGTCTVGVVCLMHRRFMLGGAMCIIPIFAYIGARTPSEAYIPLAVPGISLMIGMTVYFLKKQLLQLTALFLLGVWGISGSLYLIERQFLLDQPNGYGASLTERLMLVDTVINRIGKDTPHIWEQTGPGKEFRSSTMQYEYLAWWKGATPTLNQHAPYRIRVSDNPDGTLTYQIVVQ